MPSKKDDAKPKGKSTAYTYFVNTCRDEHKKKNPSEAIVLSDFSKKCGEKWKALNPKDKKRFEDLAAKDKTRFDKEMSNYTPVEGAGNGKRKRKEKKDPNAPKKPLSGFFCFCGEERSKVKAKFPDYSIGDVAKELGKRWEVCPNKSKFEALALKEKERYTKELAAYVKSGAGEAFKSKNAAATGKPAAKKSKLAVVQKKPQVVQKEEEDDDEEEEEEEGDEEEEEEEDESD